MRKLLLVSTLAFAALSACTADIFSPGSIFGGGGADGRDPRPGRDPIAAPDVVVALAAPQVRALSAAEYRRTVGDLLGLSVTTPLSQADWTAGFDNGSGILIDDNLLSAVFDESEKLAADYVRTRVASDFPCFNPATVTDACVKSIIQTLGRRAHRRTLTAAQRDELFAFFQSAANETQDRALGLQIVIARLIASPQFLYRGEVGHTAGLGADVYHLDDFEKASLISYALTGSMPDDALLADAEAGALDEAGLRHHIRRLWSSDKTRDRVGDFFREWLKVTRLDEMARRPEDYAKLARPSQGASLKAEFDGFVSAVVFDGAGTLPALFTESFTFVDANTASLYAVPIPGSATARIALDPLQRKGVLGLASTMAAIANATDPAKDRPVLRGLLVKTRLLCEEVGPPSAINTIAAANAAQQTPNFDQLTTREQYEAMMQQGAQCQACHKQFMPLGFAMGRFDALGRYRTQQNGRPIDSFVQDVPFGGDAVQSFTGASDLSEAIAQSPLTARCFSLNFASFTTGLTRGEATETLADAVLQKLGPGPLEIGRFVEELLVRPELYARRGAPWVEPPVLAPVTTVLMASGADLPPDGEAKSADGQFRLTYQQDGNLVLYKPAGGAAWASNTAGTAPGHTAMQGDGNLVVYDLAGAAKFNTGTQGHNGAQLQIDAAGTLYVIATDDTVLWSSKGVTP